MMNSLPHQGGCRETVEDAGGAARTGLGVGNPGMTVGCLSGLCHDKYADALRFNAPGSRLGVSSELGVFGISSRRNNMLTSNTPSILHLFAGKEVDAS